MGSAWQESKDNGRSGRHFFATGTVPNHWTRHGDGRHMADKGHPRNHQGRRPCSTRATTVSVLTIFEAKITADLVNELAMGPSEASNVARCAGADWHAPDDWKRKVVEAIERSAHVARVFLLWHGPTRGGSRFRLTQTKTDRLGSSPCRNMKSGWQNPLLFCPPQIFFRSSTKSEQIRNGSDDSRSRKKP